MLVWVHSLTFKIKHLDILKLWFKNGSIFKTVILNILLMKSEYSYAKAHEEKQIYVNRLIWEYGYLDFKWKDFFCFLTQKK